MANSSEDRHEDTSGSSSGLRPDARQNDARQEDTPRWLFVTGKLAEHALRHTLEDPGCQSGFIPEIAVLPISVVALATTEWISSHLELPGHIDRIYLPGLCRGDVTLLEQRWGRPVVRGPADLRDLPEALGQRGKRGDDYGGHDIAIVAEINHVPQLSRQELVLQARKLREDGADMIDIGCDPGGPWPGVADAVAALKDEGLRVSIDSFDLGEIGPAVRAGAELVFSVNGSNRAWARDWGVEVVAIPDDPSTLAGLDETVSQLANWGVSFRIDPVLSPIGFGFAGSLGRYLEVRRRYGDAEMLMGTGNVTELTDADSAGLNVLLLGFCQEVGIRSVLTTQVINWCRSSVRELNLARRLVYHAVRHQVLPKRLEPQLVLLRDPRLHAFGREELSDLASRIKDANLRLFAEQGQIHAMNNSFHLSSHDPFALFDQIQERLELEPAHAFYLGFEMAKALTALTLGKDYVQDQALRWGFLTVPEKSHRDTMKAGAELPEAGAP